MEPEEHLARAEELLAAADAQLEPQLGTVLLSIAHLLAVDGAPAPEDPEVAGIRKLATQTRLHAQFLQAQRVVDQEKDAARTRRLGGRY